MFIKSLHIKGMLSFQDMSLEMRPLNVLIGPNASGKSNLIEIIALLQSLPRDLSGFISASGGISEWLWKGTGHENGLARNGSIEALLYPSVIEMPLRYGLKISESFQDMVVVEEFLENKQPLPGELNPCRHFHAQHGQGTIRAQNGNEKNSTIALDHNSLARGQSVLREIKNTAKRPEMLRVRHELDEIRLYRNANMARDSAVRIPQPTNGPSLYLEENFSNLALILYHLRNMEPVMREIEENLRKFYELYEQVGVSVEAGTAQLWLREKGLQDVIPASRLSDGTLRYLALLTILCHPTPPPLVCIEEPELGLHPDMMPELGRLLISASERTQLIVTTHSRDLIDRLWEDVESVVVCERDFDSGSEFKRLSEDRLEKWLARYELGELWGKGELGGNRW